MSTLLTPIIQQISIDRDRFKMLVNGGVNDTVQLEYRVERSIAGMVKERMDSLTVDLTTALTQAQQYRDEAKAAADHIDVIYPQMTDMYTETASNTLDARESAASASQSASTAQSILEYLNMMNSTKVAAVFDMPGLYPNPQMSVQKYPTNRLNLVGRFFEAASNKFRWVDRKFEVVVLAAGADFVETEIYDVDPNYTIFHTWTGKVDSYYKNTGITLDPSRVYAWRCIDRYYNVDEMERGKYQEPLKEVRHRWNKFMVDAQAGYINKPSKPEVYSDNSSGIVYVKSNKPSKHTSTTLDYVKIRAYRDQVLFLEDYQAVRGDNTYTIPLDEIGQGTVNIQVQYVSNPTIFTGSDYGQQLLGQEPPRLSPWSDNTQFVTIEKTANKIAVLCDEHTHDVFDEFSKVVMDAGKHQFVKVFSGVGEKLSTAHTKYHQSIVDFNPDIMIVALGINDVYSENVSSSVVNDRWSSLVNPIKQKIPNVKVISIKTLVWDESASTAPGTGMTNKNTIPKFQNTISFEGKTMSVVNDEIYHNTAIHASNISSHDKLHQLNTHAATGNTVCTYDIFKAHRLGMGVGEFGVNMFAAKAMALGIIDEIKTILGYDGNGRQSMRLSSLFSTIMSGSGTGYNKKYTVKSNDSAMVAAQRMGLSQDTLEGNWIFPFPNISFGASDKIFSSDAFVSCSLSGIPTDSAVSIYTQSGWVNRGKIVSKHAAVDLNLSGIHDLGWTKNGGVRKFGISFLFGGKNYTFWNPVNVIGSAENRNLLPYYQTKSVVATTVINVLESTTHRVDATVNRTLTLSNSTLSSEIAQSIVIFVSGSGGTITWPAQISWADNKQPELGTNWTLVYLFWTGTMWVGMEGQKQ